MSSCVSFNSFTLGLIYTSLIDQVNKIAVSLLHFVNSGVEVGQIPIALLNLKFLSCSEVR